MKKIILLTGFVFTSILVQSQSEKYSTAMKANIVMLDSALVKGELNGISNSFKRIADAEKTEWLPYYYAAYSTVMQAFMQQDKSKTDAIADEAERLINQAEALAKTPNSEIYVIKSMIASAHMMVDPQARWQTYGPAAAENIMKAKSLDPLNPRPVYLEGQAKFYTPEALGGGKLQAKALFEKALQMFDNFQPASPLHPSWGKMTTQYFLKRD